MRQLPAQCGTTIFNRHNRRRDFFNFLFGQRRFWARVWSPPVIFPIFNTLALIDIENCISARVAQRQI